MITALTHTGVAAKWGAVVISLLSSCTAVCVLVLVYSATLLALRANLEPSVILLLPAAKRLTS